jgi:hypothetical protein
MRARRSSYVLLLTAVAMAQGSSEPASVEGTVIHSITGVPIVRAHIALRGSGPNPKIYGAVTTAEGKFSITGVAPGAYQALAERVGFFLPAGPGGRTTVDVAVRPGVTREDLKFRLAPLGSISGRVVDKEGEPVEAAAVSVETGPVSSTIFDTADDKGQFRLAGLQPGRYRVRAAVSSVLPFTSRPEIRSDGTVEFRYAPTYSGGVTDYKSATRIEVETGAEVSGIEIRMAQTPMTRVSGKVLGVPPETRGLSLRFNQIYGARPVSGSVRKDGSFEFWNVDPGRYFLSAMFFSANQMVQTAPVNLDIGQSNIENVEVRVVPPSDMQGQIVFEDEQARPQPNAPKPKLEVRTVDPVSAAPTVSDVAPDGTFRLNGVAPARYRVMLSWPTAWVKAVTLGTTQAEGNVLNLRGGANGAPLTVLVSSAFGTISGKVLDGDNPVAGARIALVRDDFVSLGDVTFTASDASGSYHIANVRPGKYRLAAIEEIDDGPRAGNMDDYEDILARIDVQPKDNVTKDLKRHRPVK